MTDFRRLGGLAIAPKNAIEIGDAPWSSSVIDYFVNLFHTEGFNPRWQCGNWTPLVGWTHIVSDIAIFGAYFAIPLALFIFIAKRKDVPLKGIVWLFIAFILSCGLTHLLDASMFYHPMYRLLGLFKLITAIVSITTVLALVRVLPAALMLPGLASAHASLTKELQTRQDREKKLSKIRDELEQRSSQLTIKERRLRDTVEAACVGAVAWHPETGAITWEVNSLDSLRQVMPILGDFPSWQHVLEEASWERLRAVSVDASQGERSFDVELTLAGHGVRTDERIMLCAKVEGIATGKPSASGMFRLTRSKSSGPGGV